MEEPVTLNMNQPNPVDATKEPTTSASVTDPQSQKTTRILDHGYIGLIDVWGSDERIIESARMSTNKGFQGWDLDQRLLTYLYEHQHMTPFEMCGLTVEVQAPIFVFREWHRHRTQSYNELSARYTELPDLFYVPEDARIQKQSKKNKQGSEEQFDELDTIFIRWDIQDCYKNCRKVYEELLAKGVAREIARLVIPVAQYSRMRASANLRNWLAFLTLRMDPAAQWEIRQYANAVGEIIKQAFPRVWSLYEHSGATPAGSGG
jgi:thymidylate synthase (FAD)